MGEDVDDVLVDPEYVLALDIATTTGYALFKINTKDVELVTFGTKSLPKSAIEYGEYPWNILYASKELAQAIFELVRDHKPTIVVIEETNSGGRASGYSQKLLEFLHNAVLNHLDPREEQEAPEVAYVLTRTWRKALGIKLSPEDKINNRKLSAAKSSAKKKKSKLDKSALGIKGKITLKHKSVQFVNERFGLGLIAKDDDIADAICLGLAYITGE